MAIRNAKPRPKPYRMFDERGLYLEVAPSGGKWWRWRYRFNGKAKLLSMGTFPDVPLQTHPSKPAIKGARELREEARALLASGVDPSAHRKAGKAARSDRAANSFELVTR